MHDAASGTKRFADSINEVTRAAGHSTPAAIDVAAAASQMSSESGELQREVERFLAAICTARGIHRISR